MKIWMLSLLLLALVTASGCGGKKSDGFDRKENPETGPLKVPFVRKPLSKVPPIVKEKIENSLGRESAELVTDDGIFWVVLTRGEMRTGGYEVRVTGVAVEYTDKDESTLIVSYKYLDPAPGTFVTQALTYPSDVVMLRGIKHTPEKVKFIKIN